MKKILVGFFGIFLVLGIVAGTGYALYSSTVSVKGATIGTAQTGLKIDAFGNFDGIAGKEWLSSLPGYDPYLIELGGESIIGRTLYPGQKSWGHIKLINTSTENMSLTVTGKINSVVMDDDWNDLKNDLLMRLCTVDGIAPGDTPTACTPEYYLYQWYGTAREFPGNPLVDSQQYWVEVRMPVGAAASTAGKTITGLEFLITGTQAQ